MNQETEAEKFEKELIRRGLAEKTIREYMIRFRKVEKDIPLTEQQLYDFLDQSSGSIPRAFVKIYVEVYGMKDFKLPRKTGRKPVRLPKTMTEEEYDKLREAIYKRNAKWGLMLDISYWCGMRRAEVTSLTVDNFLFDEWKGEGHTCRVKFIGKGNKERLAVLPAWLMPAILSYLDHMANMGMPDKARIFQVLPTTWGKIFTQMSLRVLGKKYTTHHMRHTRALLWRRSGVTIDQVARRLGHTSIATTQMYWNLDLEEVAQDWENEMS